MISKLKIFEKQYGIYFKHLNTSLLEFAKKILINTYAINLQTLGSTTGRILLQMLHLYTGGCNPVRHFNAPGKTQTLISAHCIIILNSHYHNSDTLMHSLRPQTGNPMELKPLTLRFKVDYVAGLSLLHLS